MGKGWGVVILLLVPVGVAALAGCVDCTSGPPVTARGITDGSSSAGTGAFSMNILVTDGPGGAPLPGAGVVVYWASTTAREWEGPLVEVEGGPSGGRVVVNPQMDQRTVEPDRTVRLFTDGGGRAQASVPGGRIVGIVAAKDGFTEEWVPALATGDSGSATFALPLFHQALTIEAERVWGPAAGSPGMATNGNYAWNPAPIAFGEDAETNRGYAARVIEMTITLAWQNTPTTYGDLGIGLGPNDEEGPTYFRNPNYDATPGQRIEKITIRVDELVEHDLLAAPQIYLGAATENAFVAPFGMPHLLTVEARFDRALAETAANCGSGGANDNDMDVPGFGALMAIAAVTGGAMLAAIVRGRAR